MSEGAGGGRAATLFGLIILVAAFTVAMLADAVRTDAQAAQRINRVNAGAVKLRGKLKVRPKLRLKATKKRKARRKATVKKRRAIRKNTKKAGAKRGKAAKRKRAARRNAAANRKNAANRKLRAKRNAAAKRRAKRKTAVARIAAGRTTPPPPPPGRGTVPGSAFPGRGTPTHPGGGRTVNPGGRLWQPLVFGAFANIVPPRRTIERSEALPPRVRKHIKTTPTRQFLPERNVDRDYRPREVLVTVKKGTSGAALRRLARRHGLRLVSSRRVRLLDVTVHQFSLPRGRSVPGTVARLKRDPIVDTTQANHIHGVAGATKAVAKPDSTELQYALAMLRVPAAHQRSTGKNVKVAVIDTGVDLSHPALKNVVVASYDATGDRTSRPQAHGTAMAGIIGARATLQGVAPSAHILAAGAFSTGKGKSRGEADTLALERAIDWAEAEGARVFNMSFAGPRDALLIKLIEAVHARGIIMVAAAGNGGAKSKPLYPAAHKHVIAVTAIDWTDKLYEMANQGKYITVSAPGVDILTLAPSKNFGMMSGTSLASAHISGLIALILEKQPDLSPDEIKALITQSAIDLGPKGLDSQYGAGRADAMEALGARDEAKQARR